MAECTHCFSSAFPAEYSSELCSFVSMDQNVDSNKLWKTNNMKLYFTRDVYLLWLSLICFRPCFCSRYGIGFKEFLVYWFFLKTMANASIMSLVVTWHISFFFICQTVTSQYSQWFFKNVKWQTKPCQKSGHFSMTS